VKPHHGRDVGTASSELERHCSAEAVPDRCQLRRIDFLLRQEDGQSFSRHFANHLWIGPQRLESLHRLVAGWGLSVAEIVKSEGRVTETGQPLCSTLGVRL
jgi:hypothetical protein